MDCPGCGAADGDCHEPGCSWEQCLQCGRELAGCGHTPSPGDRLPWSGSCFWLDACRKLKLFKKQVCGLWVPCRPDDPDSVPDVTRLSRGYQWDRRARRFIRQTRVRP